MNAASAPARVVVPAALLCIVGALLTPVMPFVGVPLCAAALAGLVYQGRAVVAVFAAAVAVVIAAYVRPSDVAILVPAFGAIMLAAYALRGRAALDIGVALVPALALAFALGEYATAWMKGIGYREYVGEVVTMIRPTLDRLVTAEPTSTEALVDTLIRFAPSGYLMLGAITAVPTVLAMIWAADRSGSIVNRLPALREFDLSPHVIWVPILALGSLAAGRLMGQPEGIATTVGINLLFAARIAMFAQGLGVVSSWFHTIGIKRPGRVIGYVIAFLLDSLVWIVSLLGLIDFWANLRKLERSDTPAPRESRSDADR